MLDKLPLDITERIATHLTAQERQALAAVCANGRAAAEQACRRAFRTALCVDAFERLDEARGERSWTQLFAAEEMSIAPPPEEGLAWCRPFRSAARWRMAHSGTAWHLEKHQRLPTHSTSSHVVARAIGRWTTPQSTTWLSAPRYAWLSENLDPRTPTPNSAYSVTLGGTTTRVGFDGLRQDSTQGGPSRQVSWLVMDHFRPYAAACCPSNGAHGKDPYPDAWRIGIYDLSMVSQDVSTNVRTCERTPLRPCFAHFHLPWEPEALRLWVGNSLLRVLVKEPRQETVWIYSMGLSACSEFNFRPPSDSPFL